MKITPHILSIAPHISTPWKNISSMYVKEEGGALRLIVILKDGPQVEIPHLNRETVALIFDAHAEYSENQARPPSSEEGSPITFTLPLKSGQGNTLEAFPPSIQHNPEQADLPPLPESVLKKISAIATALGVDSLDNLTKAEPGCNCVYCQVMKAINGSEESEEQITEEDLKFRSWEVQQTAEKLYSVSNPIDTNEKYSVFLGEPIGCTCGNKNCEHIRAVLNT